jgi:phospho-N-acetylmuramoyl-pentapeptide-transferase
MIYHVAAYLKPYLSVLNLVHYVSFRSIAALLSTLGLCIFSGSWFIERSKLFFRSAPRLYTPVSHQAKGQMPTMGGLFILSAVVINTLLWCNLLDIKIWLFLLLIIAFGLIGLWDDISKIKHKKGISAGLKFGLQCLSAFIISALAVKFDALEPIIVLPLLKDIMISIGWGWIIWAIFIMVGCSNAVNLTDGLDGLAIGSLIPNFAVFGIISYLAGHKLLASYLYIPYAHSEQMAVISAILVGASLGFLWFNAYPAQIFMGDVGSLSLGAALAYIALVSKQELLLPIAGGLFVLETISVILQIVFIRLFGKKIFRMAPIHHHFELIGWPESRITIRFCIISLVLCLVALITLKIR